ncbi:MarR family winged helix-turn-helix transcriptional regulator [Clostridium botulinum]|uniref:MarR family winged helix-turn-helix transcriptional regulator n=1 Tax=Clostridium botulinum TaxID=1491 RepID=UPI001C9AAEE9|nr:MarR family transcriptional regulator [Clostridium botulinum]MBY6809120.1 MarR family transcriptional regulator [Clostridium botulinum]MBY6822175.1 MarR family transcriptional regulator [Clostridium botulinum]MBY6833035.1 MarR family transcriptional regulator [Clostridium botulinum]MBY6972263.1 MarR family transcriptional regulator [Clostridium botulinum]MCS6104683.1 MarR family transcriptional regulator [Clostridium botulinum]
MYNNKIFRNTQGYLDKALKKYDLSSGAYPYLMVLEKNEGISQICISKEIGNDRAMSARTINKLVESEFVYRVQDEKDSRAYKLYLTSKAKEIIPLVRSEIHKLIGLITEDLTEDEKNIAIKILKSIFEKTVYLRNGENK